MPRDFIPGREPEVVASNTLTYFFREAVRRLWTSKRTSFLAIAMIAISLLILGSFLLVAENLERAVERFQGRSHVTIFFDAAATPPQVAAIEAYLISHPDFARRRFVTREQALAKFKSSFTNLSDIAGQLDENPFPPSFEVEVTAATAQRPVFAREVSELRAMPGVEEVQFDWEWIRQIRRLVGLINVAGLIAGGILAIAAAFTIANVIRLTMMLYREEVEIMRLVGATERIIRGPFIIEGVLQGTIGGVLAVGILYGLFEAGRRFLAPSASLLWGFLFSGFLPWQKIAALIAGGMFAGWFGSWLSVRDRGRETT